MKLHNFTSVLTLLAMLGFMPIGHAETNTSETTIEDVRQDTANLIKTLKGYGVKQREQVVQKTDKALVKLDARIDALETQIDNNWEQMDKTTRNKARKSLRALRKQRAELAEWYGGWKNSSASAWEKMKKGFSGAYQELTNAWEKAASEFSNEK
tara:strand:- start:29665 stop:30126 length:462 start_codon:yes stop_codon:yes gene_type:complete